MAGRSVLQAFEKFQKERLVFVTTIGELAKAPQNVEFLERAGALSVLKSLLIDPVPSVQHAAAVALGRLAHAEDRLAEALVQLEILPVLVASIAKSESRYTRRAAAFCLRAVARHSPSLAQTVVNSGATRPLVTCLEDLDTSVKEAAAWTLGYIASHAPDLAQGVADAQCIPLLVLCVQETDASLKRIAISALGDIAKHSSDLAQLVVDAGAVSHVVQLISSQDAKLRRQAFACLANVAKHTADLAEVLIDAQVFPKMLTSLKFPDDFVKKHSATVVREVCKHTPELAQLVVSYGSVAALVDHIADSEGHFRLPSVMAIGFIGASSETLAATVIAENGVQPIVDVLRTEADDVMKSAAVWTLGQIGKHSSEHAKAVAETGILLELVDFDASESASEDLKSKCRQSLKAIVAKLMHLPSLDALVHRRADDNVMQLVLEQLAKVLAGDPQGRSQFVHTGGLALLQHIAEAPDSSLVDVIHAINSHYPEEIVMHYSPSYSQKLLEKLDAQISQTVN